MLVGVHFSREIMKMLVNKYHAAGHEVYPQDEEARADVNKYLELDKQKIYSAVSEWVVSTGRVVHVFLATTELVVTV